MTADDEDQCRSDIAGAARTPGYVRALRLVVVLNAAMFFLGGAIALMGRSVSVQADALDFFGDAVATGIGLALVGAAAQIRNRVAFWQGTALGGLGLFTLGSALWRIQFPATPAASAMGLYGVLGLAINVASALLLLRHREGDATVRAVWLYSRNDAIGNIAVLAASGVVAWTGSHWPDIAVGAVLAALFLHAAYEILRQASRERREARIEERSGRRHH